MAVDLKILLISALEDFLTKSLAVPYGIPPLGYLTIWPGELVTVPDGEEFPKVYYHQKRPSHLCRDPRLGESRLSCSSCLLCWPSSVGNNTEGHPKCSLLNTIIGERQRTVIICTHLIPFRNTHNPGGEGTIRSRSGYSKHLSASVVLLPVSRRCRFNRKGHLHYQPRTGQ